MKKLSHNISKQLPVYNARMNYDDYIDNNSHVINSSITFESQTLLNRYIISNPYEVESIEKIKR